LKLFESGKVVDTFRDINASGSDKAGEHTQGLTHGLNNLGSDARLCTQHFELSGASENDISQSVAMNLWFIRIFVATLNLNTLDSADIIIYPN
jgi:hypothetical protein